MENLCAIERRIIRAVINHALNNTWQIGVYDGEEWTVKFSHDYKTIADAIGTTDETMLRFRDLTGRKIGDMFLIHGNLEDVIADTSDTPQMDELFRTALQAAGV